MSSLLPCPFCGLEINEDDPDIIHPMGMYWYLDPSSDIKMFGEDTGFIYSTQERTENPYWMINCPEIYGGCSASIVGLTKDEVIEKWQKRK